MSLAPHVHVGGVGGACARGPLPRTALSAAGRVRLLSTGETIMCPAPRLQALFLAIHELAHNLFFKTPLYNRLFSFVANWPIGIPYTIPFRGYHLDHHKFQGVDGIDTDIPSRLEGRIVRGPVTKAIWACCQILTYALRPVFIKRQEITRMHIYNWISQIAFDGVMLYFFGWRPLAYMVLCIFLAGGLHPCAGHFISEHYVFPHLSATQVRAAVPASPLGTRRLNFPPPNPRRPCRRPTPTTAGSTY